MLQSGEGTAKNIPIISNDTALDSSPLIGLTRALVYLDICNSLFGVNYNYNYNNV